MTGRPTTRTWVAAVAVLATVVVAAGCGKSQPETTSATDWANGLCSAITTWKTSLTAAADPIKSGSLSKDSVQAAANDAKAATDTFVSDLKGLGKPDTDAGAQAKQDVDQLATQITDGVQSIQDSLKGASSLSAIISAVPTITTGLQTMSNEVTTTISDIQKLDAKGELKDAFTSADSCKPYTSSS